MAAKTTFHFKFVNESEGDSFFVRVKKNLKYEEKNPASVLLGVHSHQREKENERGRERGKER